MRRRILLLVVGMTTLVVLAFAIPIAVLIHSAAAQRADGATKDRALSIASALRNGALTKSEIRTYVAEQIEDSGRRVAVTCPDGTQIGDNLPGGSPDHGPPGEHLEGGGQDGKPDDDHAAQALLRDVAGGQLASVMAPTPSGTYLVEVFQSNGERYGGTDGWYLLLAAGAVALLLIGVVAGEVLTRRIARPLVRTAETAQQLSIGETSARAPTDGPREVADVGKALNRLADRIDELIAEERETVADLSHRLRTPLTTLRLGVEALRDPNEAERLGSHVSDLERMLTAVIHAARRPQREGRMPSCDATAVVGERVRFWSALTDEQGRASSVALTADPLPVRAAAEDLAAAVDALLENVVAHTPEGVPFAVRLTRTDAGGRLEIADDGPGIPDAADIRGRSDRGSTGLGLDIARRCAEGSGGAMTIGSTPSGGALITLDLRAP